MSEPTRASFDRTSEWGADRQPAPTSDTSPGVSEHTAAFTASDPVSPLAAPKAVTLPCDFGDYELQQEIAHGGMGVVYRAKQKSLARIVALKMILPHLVATEIAIERFEREARSAAALDHPNIVPIYEIGERMGRYYFTMAFIEGTTLKARVADQTLTRKEILDLFVPITEAVAFAHERGIIHRDLKPDNVLIDSQGRPRITDFGLAKPTSGSAELTSTGQILGTPAYMAPEQALGGDRKIGPEADVYALGSILFFLLAGEPPFGGQSVTEILFRVVNDAVPDAPQRAVGMTDLDSICRKCLQKAPAARFPDGRALLAALRELPSDRVATPLELANILGPSGSRYVDPKKLIAKPTSAPKRRSAAFVALGLLGAAAVAGAIAWVMLNRPAGPSSDATASIVGVPISLLKPVFDNNEIKLQVKMLGTVKKLEDGVELLKDGESIGLDIVADQDAHIVIWALEEDGSIHQIFPNAKETNNKLVAGKHRIIPDPNVIDFKPTAAKGVEYIKILASNRPMALAAAAAAVERDGDFVKFTQKSGNFDTMLRGIKSSAPPEQKNGEAVVPFHVMAK